MTQALVVPRSLERPVPRSEARSRIQRLLDRNREQLEREVVGRGLRELARVLAVAEVELAARLRALRAAGRGDRYQAADAEAMLAQVRAVLVTAEPKVVDLLGLGAIEALKLGAHNTVAVLRHFEREMAGSIRPLAIAEAAALGRPLLERYPSSVARYGLHTIGLISQRLQAGIVRGATFDEMTEMLVGRQGRAGALLEHRGWAERIVRTEGMYAYNAGAHAEALEQRAKAFPDLEKRLVETFDQRTADDSRPAHGQVRALEELFVDGKGRRYLHPPGRPHDRGVEIPWRRGWVGSEATGASAVGGDTSARSPRGTMARQKKQPPIPENAPQPRNGDYRDYIEFERKARERMRELGIPERAIGIPQYPGGAYCPYTNTIGGNIVGVAINVDTGLFDDGHEKIIPGWKKATIEARLDAAIAHEWEEMNRGSHIEAVLHAPTTHLPISEEARKLLAAMQLQEKKREAARERRQERARARILRQEANESGSEKDET